MFFFFLSRHEHLWITRKGILDKSISEHPHLWKIWLLAMIMWFFLVMQWYKTRKPNTKRYSLSFPVPLAWFGLFMTNFNSNLCEYNIGGHMTYFLCRTSLRYIQNVRVENDYTDTHISVWLYTLIPKSRQTLNADWIRKCITIVNRRYKT